MSRSFRVLLPLVMIAALGPLAGLAQYPSALVGFNGPPIDDPATCQEMFKVPQYSGSTSAYVVPNTGSQFDHNWAYRASGYQTEGDGALRVGFTWVDPNSPDGWVRLTTFNGPIWPNPSLQTEGKVRFKLVNISELFAGEVGIILGIRETGVVAPQLSDGGTSGSIEWVGVDPTPNAIIVGPNFIVNTAATGDDVQVYPVGTDLGPGGLNLPPGTAVITPGPNGVLNTTPAGDDLIRAGYRLSNTGAVVPIPVVTFPPSPLGYDIEFNLATGTITVDGIPSAAGFAPFTGDGVLAAPNDRGTLEHIGIIKIDTASNIDVYIDELQFDSPVPDPVLPPTIVEPLLMGATEVVVTDIMPTADLVNLYRNGSFLAQQVPVPPNDVTFTIAPAVPGDIYTATIVVDGTESPPSDPVQVILPAPTLAGPIVPEAVRVAVYGLLASPAAELVSAYVNGVLVGSAVPSGGIGYVDVGDLDIGDVITATQTVAGVESLPSNAVTVGVSNPPVIFNWTQTSTLPWGLTDHQVVYLNGYVYAIGGRSNESDPDTYATDTVYYAAVNGDGSLGPWQATALLPDNRATHGAAVWNGRIYVWGGWRNDYTTMGTCWYTTPNPDGSISAWTTSTVVIPMSDESTPTQQMDSFGRGLVQFRDTLYIVNGEANSGVNQNETFYSRLQPGGDYGEWVETANTTTNSWFHGVAAFECTSGDYLWRVAGNYEGTNEWDMLRAPINADGSLGDWVLDPLHAPERRYEFACVGVDYKIFMVAGLFGSTSKNTVFYALIDPDTGAIREWKTGTPYPETLARTAGVAYTIGGDNYLLIVSGGPYSRTGIRNPNCWYTKLTPDTDGDGVADALDNCVWLYNPSQTDTDGDGIGDACEGLAPPVCVGDTNCDGVVGFGDINPFVAGLTGGPMCNPDNFDINQNGTVGFDDINPFVALLSGGGGPCP